MTVSELFRGKTDSSRVQFLRSVLVSNVAFLVDFLLCLLFVGTLGIGYVPATAMSFTLASILNYRLSILWVFEGDKEERRLEFLAFLAVSFVGLGLNALGMHLFANVLGVHYLVARVMAASLVFLFNFGCKKELVFGWLARHPEISRGFARGLGRSLGRAFGLAHRGKRG